MEERKKLLVFEPPFSPVPWSHGHDFGVILPAGVPFILSLHPKQWLFRTSSPSLPRCRAVKTETLDLCKRGKAAKLSKWRKDRLLINLLSLARHLASAHLVCPQHRAEAAAWAGWWWPSLSGARDTLNLVEGWWRFFHRLWMRPEEYLNAADVCSLVLSSVSNLRCCGGKVRGSALSP